MQCNAIPKRKLAFLSRVEPSRVESSRVEKSFVQLPHSVHSRRTHKKALLLHHPPNQQKQDILQSVVGASKSVTNGRTNAVVGSRESHTHTSKQASNTHCHIHTHLFVSIAVVCWTQSMNDTHSVVVLSIMCAADQGQSSNDC